MKYIQNLNISIPVFQIDSKISYQTIRQPTVFEKSILQLCDKYNKELGHYTFEQIAAELKVLPIFFNDALNYLTEFKAIKKQTGNTLADCQITSEGREFLSRNQLPSNDKIETDAFIYHPIKKELIKKQELAALKKIDIKLTSDDFNVTEAVVRDMVAKQIKMQWGKANTRLGKITSTLQNDILQDTETLSLNIDTNGNLTILTYDERLQSWIDSANKVFLWEALLSPFFKIMPTAIEEVEKTPWENISAVYPSIDRPKLNENNRILLNIFNHSSPITTVPSIYLSADNKTVLKQQNLILSKQALGIEDSLECISIYKDGEITTSCKGMKNIYFAGQEHKVELGFESNDDAVWKIIKDTLDSSKSLDIILFSALLDLDKAIQRLPQASVLECKKYYERIKEINNLVKPDMFTEKIMVIGDIESFKVIRTFIPNYSISLEKMTDKLVESLINQSLSNREPINNCTISTYINQLSNAYFSIKDSVGEDFFTDQNSLSADTLKPTKKLRKQLKDWKNSRTALDEKLIGLNVETEQLDAIQKKISALESTIRIHFAPIRSDSKRIVVMDTNCLMHTNSIDNINVNDYVIIPDTVLRELDGLKQNNPQNPERAVNARAAIRKINQLKHTLSFEEEHPILLGKDDISNDEKIISVAIYYQSNEVILLSNDNNMRNQAASQGITAISSENYLKKGKKNECTP